MIKDIIKEVIKDTKEHSEPIVADALTKGATHLSNKMNDVVNDVNQSPPILLKEIAITLRNSAIITGREMMMRELEFIQKKRA
ncbi:hypothetical protein ACTWP4_04310 [Gracilibacillus sp. D59]|uniref:hypothetical protein n=1 Tax=Gracilibacillus sp. D59 TaxID=3457434 RepID=UPI003FCC2959